MPSNSLRHSDLTRQAISLYTRAERGAGFPGPVAKVTSKHPLWDWHEVAGWLFRNGRIDRDEMVRAKLVKEANLHLETHGSDADNFLTKLLEAVEAA